MAIKLYEKDINKHVNWGGDESTGGLPVSGEKIQEFIKKSLDSKFGFMYYDKDAETKETTTGVTVVNHTPSKQYIVFSDQEDFIEWAGNPSANNALIRARFDAPAPATIEIVENSALINTILLSDKDNQNLSFKCIVKDQSNNVVTDTCSVNISIINNISGTYTLPTYLPLEQNDSFTFNFNNILSDKLGTYLFEGTNMVRCTITSQLYNVSTTLTFQFRVLNLNLTCDFDNIQSPFNMYNTISMKDNVGFETTITAYGTGQKYLRVFVDGERINLLTNGQQPNELYLGANNPEMTNIIIPFKDLNDNQYSWVSEGKHNLQMYFYILDNNNNEIKSQTLYYDFVLVDNNIQEHSYILFKRTFENNSFADINSEDPSIFPKREDLNFTIESEQYLSFTTNYVILNTFGSGTNSTGNAIVVNVKLYDKTNLTTPEYTLPQAIPSGNESSFTYTTQSYGNKELHIETTVATSTGIAEISIINVNIKESDVKAKKATSGLELELNALNRSNTENEEDRNKWSYVKTTGLNPIPYNAIFNNVLWNSQNGWIDNCLVLNNGATVTIPMNIFSQGGGVTFEIDFETENVQDDDAIIMKYGAEDGAGIFINACNATLQSNNGINIHTNYKDGARQKIQFIFGYNQEADENTLNRFDCPYLMYMVVNGILDRVAQFKMDDSYIGTSEVYNQFVIGNTDGKVTTKIHSIRVYTRPLTLNECVDNYIADSSQVRKNFLRNDIYNEDGKTINISKVLGSDLHIPVMTIYGDITDSIIQVFDKKANVPVDILYQDPNFPEFNYFARDAWISNQGTSSMNYPRRNLRPYFNKEADDKTLRGHASNDRYNYETRVWWGLTDTSMITKIQSGEQNPDEPFTINGIEYKPLRNKKTLKKFPQEISYKVALMFVHSGISIFSDQKCENKIKNLNKWISENEGSPIYVQGAYARYKHKDLYTDRWTLKCDYAESSMTHNAGVGRLWGDVMRDVEIGSEGFTYDIDGNEIQSSKPGMTNAQRAVAEYNATHNDVNDGYGYGDIRTSCDGYPIIIINRPRIKNGNTFTEQYGDPVFLGLYNIMTDKGSTPLFGFENLKDEDGNTLFDASKCECWECLQNGSNLAQMNDIITDDSDGSIAPYTSLFDEKNKFIKGTGSDNEDRLIFKSYEARWPDNDDLNDTCTNNLETLIRFVNFCKDAVSVTVDGKDGYTLSDYTEITDEQASILSTYVNHPEDAQNDNELNGLNLGNWDGKLYIGVPQTSYKNKTENFYATDSDGAVIYNDALKPVLIDKETAANTLLYKGNKTIIYYKQTYAAQNVTGMSFEPIFTEDDNYTAVQKINAIYDVLESNKNPYVYTAEEDETQIEQVESVYYPNSGYNWYYYDKTYDRTAISKVINTTELRDDVYTGKVFTYDGKRLNNENEQLHPDAWVTVYLTKNGNNYTYKNELGANKLYSSGEEVVTVTGNGHAGVVSKGASFKGHTLFEFFQDQKYEHFDVWKLACYYIYLMRFAGVDQVIKNTMMTTEDGIHYYYINYDNDTVLGVRNDGYLVYDWQVDRNTYDESIGGYAFAGFGSVLWNLLEQDDDFMSKVQTAAKAMVTSNVLTYDIAIDMFNNKQSGTWSERLYNNSEMYKYIGIFNDIDNYGTDSYNPYQNTKYLPFLQGSRASHRDWWLRHRFDLYDAKWSAGEYEKAKIEVYMSATASPNNPANICTIVTGSKFYYTVLSNGRLLGNNFVELGNNIKHTFQTTSPLAIGDPLAILGGYNIKVLDFSEQRDNLGSSLAFNWDDNKFTSKMTQLILGGDVPTTGANAQPGCSLGSIVGLQKLAALEVLDIRTAYNIKSVEISNLVNLKKFLANGSAITNFKPATGVILEEVSLPSSITTLQLNDITLNNLTFEPGIALTKVDISNVNGEALEGNNLFDFILNWYITLKKANVLMTNYSCTLSFNKIELEQYYGDENGEITSDVNEWIDSLNTNTPKKIKSLDLLNAIKRDFGLNNFGEENFHITEGIIKLYGDNDNGGLTQENYEMMISATFNGSTTKLWNDEAFQSDKRFHFDSNSSVFVTVTAYSEDYKDPINDNGNYTIIAGQIAKIKVTIFPIDNTRKINIHPYSIDSISGILTSWNINSSTGAYEKSFISNAKSTLMNYNDTGILNIYEYTDTSEKSVKVVVTESIPSVNNGEPSEVINFDIAIENAVKPTTDNIQLTYVPNDNSASQIINKNQIHEIDIVDDYNYIVSFNNQNELNVDVDNISASFNSNTVINSNEFGELSTIFNETLNAYVIKYTPIIPQVDTIIPMYVFVQLKDRTNSVISSYIRISLKTKAIESITLTYNENSVDVNNDDIINYSNIEHYVTSESDIKTVNNQKIVSYRYYININPNGYNIPVKSMRIVTPEGIYTTYNIVTHNSIDNPLIIDYIDINMPVSLTSLYQIGEFTIVVTDIYDTVTQLKVNVTLGYFIPTGIYLARTLTINGHDEFDITNNANNISLLINQLPQVTYNLYTYSKVGNYIYIWGDGDQVRNYYNGSENVRFLSSNQYPNAQYSELSNSSIFPYNNETDDPKYALRTYTTGITPLIDGSNRGFQFMLLDATAEAIFSMYGKLRFTVTFNNITATYDDYVNVERTPALATNFDIHNANIIAMGDTVNGQIINDPTKCLYYLDRNLRLYTYDGFNQLKDKLNLTSVNAIKNYILALIYVYKDSDSVRKYTSLDPWKLMDNHKQVYMWWPSDSTFCGASQNFGSQTAIYALLGNRNAGTKSNANLIANYSESVLYNTYYDYYRIYAAIYHDPSAGGPSDGFRLRVIEEGYQMPNNLEDICDAFYNKKIELTNSSVVENQNMIFYYINDYKDISNNIICKPLSLQDIQNVMNNYDTFATYLNALDSENEYHLAKNLFDITDENKFHIDHHHVDNNENGRGFDYMYYPGATYENYYTHLQNSKTFWYFSGPTEGGKFKENVQVAINLRGEDTDIMDYNVNTTSESQRLNPQTLMYCLFGPKLVQMQ